MPSLGLKKKRVLSARCRHMSPKNITESCKEGVVNDPAEMALVGWRGKNPIVIGWGIIRRLIE